MTSRLSLTGINVIFVFFPPAVSDNVLQLSFVLSNTTWDDDLLNSTHPEYEALRDSILQEVGACCWWYGGTVVSTRAFHLCDPGSIPAQYSYLIKIPPWSHVSRVFPV